MPAIGRSESAATVTKARSWRFYLGASLIGYVGYLLLMGPYLRLLDSGDLDSMPRPAQDAIFVPAWPVYQVPVVRSIYDGYLTHWSDPGFDMPTGWH